MSIKPVYRDLSQTTLVGQPTEPLPSLPLSSDTSSDKELQNSGSDTHPIILSEPRANLNPEEAGEGSGIEFDLGTGSSSLKREGKLAEGEPNAEFEKDRCKQNLSEPPPSLSSVQEVKLVSSSTDFSSPEYQAWVNRLKKILRDPYMPSHFPGRLLGISPDLLNVYRNLKMRFLDEAKSDTDFQSRSGAFAYLQVFNYSSNLFLLYKANIDSLSLEERMIHCSVGFNSLKLCRNVKLPPKMRELFNSILEPLNNGLFLTFEQCGPQIGVFREILFDIAQLQIETPPGAEMDPVKILELSKRLDPLESSLMQMIEMVQEKKVAFQPLAILCRKLDLGQYQGVVLTDLEGNVKVAVPPDIKPSAAMVKEYKLLAEIYGAYFDSILDPHFFYCSKFLTAISTFREEISNPIPVSRSLQESTVSELDSQRVKRGLQSASYTRV